MNATPNQSPSVKQQRASAREAKLAAFRAAEAKRKRNRVIGLSAGIGVGALAVLGVVAVFVSSLVFAPKAASYTAGGSGETIEGVELFENGAGHVETPVEYPQTPPAGGEHNPVWLNCGVYEEPVPNEAAVHSLEHGAIWVTYDASVVTGDQLETLKSKLPSTYVVLSPYEGLDSPIVLSGWNSQLKLEEASDPRIPAFFEEYWQSQNVPEPGAMCTGAYDAPGKVS